jgi:hypothetical protein
MIKTIIASVFAVYQLTSGENNRLLLQAGPANPNAVGWVPITLPTNAQQATVMECVLSHLDPAGCAGRATTITNAATNFKFECSNLGACAQANITFNFVNSHAERVEQISFSEQYAGYNAIIVIDSTESAVKQYIDKFECKAPGACENAQVKCFGGSSVNDVDCPHPNYCTNCFIYECVWGPPDAAGIKTELCGTGKACFLH